MADINTTPDIQSIPLSKLVISDLNVRRVMNRAGDTEMQASLIAFGVLENLIVYPDGKEKFAVAAGERRRRNLKALAKAKKIPNSFLVPCLVRTKEEAIELSLAENLHRDDMHPADEFDAFKAMVEQGRTVEEVATRFGKSARTVEQRLKLARVSPRLVEAFRQDEITLDAMTAFAITDDHDHQETVWKACGPNPAAHAVRRHLTQGRVDARDRRVRYISMDAYKVAGGTVTRDLFGRDDDCWLDDVALLDRLTMERMEAEAAPIHQQGWKWVQITMTEPDEFYRLRKVAPATVPLSSADADRLSALAARYDELADLIEANEDDGKAEAELQKVEAEMQIIQSQERIYTPEQRAVSGVMVFLTFEGILTAKMGLIRAEDEKALQEKSPDDQTTDTPKSALSGALIETLEQHRTAAFQVALMNAPNIAFRVVVLSMVRATIGAGYLRTITSIAASKPNLSSAKGSPAIAAMESAEENWGSRLPGEDEDLWPWIMAQEETTLMDLLAFCTAKVANAGHGVWRAEDANVTASVAQAAGLDMREFWTATAEGYFSKVSKPLILEAVTEAVGDDAARRIATMKKGDMAAAAEDMMRGKGWLPELLRTPDMTL